jgi:zeta-carotene desaturase
VVTAADAPPAPRTGESGGPGRRPTPRTALVAGGGIAGLSCALRLAEAGVRVTLLETRKKLGGRATSFKDVRSDRWLDNCQHVVLGCCTNYLDLLARLGVVDAIAWESRQWWAEEGGRLSVIRRGPLPAPAHFTGSMLRAGFLSVGEKLHIARACAAILRADRREWTARTFADFLRAHGQPDRAVRRFWAPVVVSACNLDVDRVAASSALHVFQEGFLAAPAAADIGVPSVPLLHLYDAAERLIAAAGGRVELGAGVERLDARSATTTDGQRFEADAVVCALPVERVTRAVPPEARAGDARFERLDDFTHSPILGVHLTFDRPALPADGRTGAPIPHAVLVDRPTQWVFRKDDHGRQLHAVVSAADAWLPLTEAQVGERVLADLHACLPASRDAKLLEVRAVKEKLATFAPTPGVEALRPGPVGPSGIVLAGDYTHTGWPATMEGATRSGYAAAAAVLGRPASELLVPGLRVAPLARALGLHPESVAV